MLRLTTSATRLFSFCSALAGMTLAAGAADRPNVLFLISDDLSAETLACYGNPHCRTPNIDALSDTGLKFTRAYCQFPVCGPSRAALMSGRYPQACGVVGNGSSGRFTEVMGDRPSMSQHFKQNGYYTARVSKIYHMRVPGDITAGVDGPDHVASWTERFNCQAPEWMSEGEHIHLTNEKLRRDPDKHYGLGFGGAFYVVKGSTDGTEQADTQAATKAIELLVQHKDEPFFLAVGFVRPHVPLVAPEEFFDPYTVEEMTLPEKRDGDWDDIPKAGISKNSKSSGLTGNLDKQREVLASYYACVEYMDAQVGRLIDALDRLGLRDDTIIVFTSDHGYHLGEHDFWQKLSLHEESTRIPLIISGPGINPAESGALAQQIDIYPTLAALANLSIPDHVQGKSLVPILEAPETSVHDEVYCFKGNGHLLRTPDWSYIRYKDGSTELYDMQNDPKQFSNLTGRQQHAAIENDMSGRLERILKAMND